MAEPITEAQAKEQGMSAEETKWAKEEGLISDEKSEENQEKPEEKAEEQTEEKTKEGTKEKTEEQPKKESEPESEESEEEKEHERVSKFNPNEKALYFKQKKERKKRQSAEKERDHLKVQQQASSQQMKKLNERLEKIEQGKDEDWSEWDEGKKDYLTKQELEKMEKEKAQKQQEQDKQRKTKAKEIEERVNESYKDAKVKYGKEFDQAMILAEQVVKDDDTGFLSVKMADEINKPDGDVAELAYTIAKYHPKFGKQGKSSPKKDENIEKAEKNLKKRSSSAALGGGSGGKKVSEEDLTVEDAAKLSQAEFEKLKPETVNRLLKQ